MYTHRLLKEQNTTMRTIRVNISYSGTLLIVFVLFCHSSDIRYDVQKCESLKQRRNDSLSIKTDVFSYFVLCLIVPSKITQWALKTVIGFDPPVRSGCTLFGRFKQCQFDPISSSKTIFVLFRLQYDNCKTF